MNRFLKVVIFLFMITLISQSRLSIASEISICTDTNFWYPFTYVNDKGEAAGFHIDIIKEALKKLGYKPLFKPMDWKACLSAVQKGQVDAIATVSYQDDRAVYLDYPPGAAVDKESPFRVDQVEYRLITSAFDEDGKPSDYLFYGNIKKIPEPVRVPKDYSIANDLRKEGLKVIEGTQEQNFEDLIKTKKGSIVDIEEVAKLYSGKTQFHGKFIIQRKALKSKSYYLAFGKKGKINLRDANRIWEEIAKIRENQPLMDKFIEKY